MAPDSSDPGMQVLWLFALAIAVACISWTVTHEEVFREFREFCNSKSHCGSIWKRKAFYLFTCEYCFSHWVTLLLLILTRYRLLFDDWRGYVLALFSLVWVANIYMSLMGRLRVDIRSERAAATVQEEQAERLRNGSDDPDLPTT